MTDAENLAELHQAVATRAESMSDYTEAAFAGLVAEALVESGSVSGFEPAPFLHRGMRLDGYSVLEEEGTLDLFVVEWSGENDVTSLTRSTLETCIKRVETFFDRAVNGGLAHEVEVASAACGASLQLQQLASMLVRVRVNVLSDCRLSALVKDLPTRIRDGREWTCRAWDLGAIGRMMSTGEPEEIAIDFVELFGRGLPCLPANVGSSELDSYLTVIPGDWLAKIYELYAGRLLEQNVRTFLQARGSVNKGIRRTILDEPHRFFAYNNGVSATAEDAVFRQSGGDGTLILDSVRHLQIVNGGQTTASIFNVLKKDKGANLQDIRVQMKLSVVKPEDVTAIVPKISEYANSQNKVNAADFFSNHPFHVRIEGLSRRIWAPAAEGSRIQTHWFYERARGQYLNATAYLSPSKKSEFESQNPRRQLVEKVDLAKVEMTWNGHPQLVCFGSQKNFSKYAEHVASEWKDEGLAFNEDWFKDMIARTIVFRSIERQVQEADWYAKGFRAQIVTYSIALFQLALSSSKRSVDFRRIWNKQAMSNPMSLCLMEVARQVNSKIMRSAAAYQMVNVTEWCKREKCWEDLKLNIKVEIDDAVEPDLISSAEMGDARRAGRKAQKELNGDEAQTHVVTRGGPYWDKMLKWATIGSLMTPGEIRELTVAAAIPRKLPSVAQSLKLLEIEAKAGLEGFRPS